MNGQGILETQATRFLDSTSASLTPYDFNLLSKLITDWHSSTGLTDLFSKWKSCQRTVTHQSHSSIHILYFNVRGLDLRWGEVCLFVKNSPL